MIKIIPFLCGVLLLVHADELLLLDNKRESAVVELKKAEATLAFRERKYKRIRSLADSRAISKEVADEAEYELEVFRLETKLKKLAVDRIDIEIRIAKKK